MREETDNFTKPFVDSSSDESDDEDVVLPKENPLVVATVTNADADADVDEDDDDDDDDKEDEEDESSGASPSKRRKVATHEDKCDGASTVKKEPAVSHQRTKLDATKNSSIVTHGESAKTKNSRTSVVSMTFRLSMLEGYKQFTFNLYFILLAYRTRNVKWRCRKPS